MGILLNRAHIQLYKSKITTFSIKILNARHFWRFFDSIASISDYHLSSPATFHSFYIILGQNRPTVFSSCKQKSKKEETLLKGGLFPCLIEIQYCVLNKIKSKYFLRKFWKFINDGFRLAIAGKTRNIWSLFF